MPKPEPRTFRITSVRRATTSTRIIRLDLDGAEFAHLPGQAATIGVAGQHETVPYSIASAPEEAAQHGWVEFLIKVEGSGRWGHKFDRLARGMRVTLDGPYGTFTFPPAPTERRFLFVAGGTGIAPVRSMLKHLELGRVPGRARLLYSARTREDFPYLPELRSMVQRGRLELTLTATREVGASWRGERGRIGASRLAPMVDHPDTLCFVCGPAAMVDDVPLMLMGLGIAANRILVEEW
jgi:propane monooxygenase reductase subunit